MSWLSWVIKPDKEAALIPARASRWLPDCDVVPISCPPIASDVPRTSILEDTAGLDDDAAFGFMARSKGGDASSESLLVPATSTEKIVYLLVGGAYLLEHSLNTHTIFSLAALTKGRVFSVNYRKSLSNGSAFPGALLDAAAGYQYLVDGLGFSPENIVLAGDSAGANLCLALIRYLNILASETSFQRWGIPAGLFLNSPWADPSGSTPSAKQWARFSIMATLVKRALAAFHTSRFPQWTSNPYFCPALTGHELFGDLAKHGTTVYISAGASEMLLDEIVLLRDSMRNRGMDVTYREIPNGTHSGFAEYQRKDGAAFEAAWRVVEGDFISFWAKILPEGRLNQRAA